MELVEKLLKGDTRSVARAITIIEDGGEETHAILKGIYPHTGRAAVIGVTGPFGTGKSSLINKLASALRREDKKVGIVAVDPTSSFSGGAILGDRIRMRDHFLDTGIFIRSMATRGQMGGLARATGDVVDVMDAAGFDTVIVETVGVGQDEVEIVNLVHTTLVVLVPGLGDDIQTFKAGLMEIADIFVINKIDMGNWELVKTQLEMMLALAEETTAWRPQIVETAANDGIGIDKLMEQIGKHQDYFLHSNEHDEKDKKKSLHRMRDILSDRIWSALQGHLSGQETLDSLVRRIVKKEIDPYTAVDYLTGKILQLENLEKRTE